MTSLYLHTTSEGGTLVRQRFRFLVTEEQQQKNSSSKEDTVIIQPREIVEDEVEKDEEYVEQQTEYKVAKPMKGSGVLSKVFGSCSGGSGRRRGHGEVGVLIAVEGWSIEMNSKILCDIIEYVLRERVGNSSSCTKQPLSDGGDGFIDAVRSIYEDSHDIVEVPNLTAGNPNGTLIIPIMINESDQLAVIQANLLLNQDTSFGLNFLETTSYGLGQLIRDCFNSLGAKKLYIGLSDDLHCVDIGIGLAKALGVQFITDSNIDQDDQIMGGIQHITDIDLSNLIHLPSGTTIKIAASNKASLYDLFQYHQIQDLELEKAMQNFSQLIGSKLGGSAEGLPSESYTGSGGGIAYMLKALFPSVVEIIDAFDLISSAADLVNLVQNSPLVITGCKAFEELQSDSLSFKMGRLCQATNTPCTLYTLQSSTHIPEALPGYGITKLVPLLPLDAPSSDLTNALQNPTELYRTALAETTDP